MAYKKTIDNMDFNELVEVCEAKGIKVTGEDDSSSLRKKLKPKPKK